MRTDVRLEEHGVPDIVLLEIEGGIQQFALVGDPAQHHVVALGMREILVHVVDRVCGLDYLLSMRQVVAHEHVQVWIIHCRPRI